jgi:hypothetical protein
MPGKNKLFHRRNFNVNWSDLPPTLREWFFNKIFGVLRFAKIEIDSIYLFTLIITFDQCTAKHNLCSWLNDKDCANGGKACAKRVFRGLIQKFQ